MNKGKTEIRAELKIKQATLQAANLRHTRELEAVLFGNLTGEALAKAEAQEETTREQVAKLREECAYLGEELYHAPEDAHLIEAEEQARFEAAIFKAETEHTLALIETEPEAETEGFFFPAFVQPFLVALAAQGKITFKPETHEYLGEGFRAYPINHHEADYLARIETAAEAEAPYYMAIWERPYIMRLEARGIITVAVENPVNGDVLAARLAR